MTAGGRLRTIMSLGQDRRGFAMTEFALCLPLLVTVGLYGMETVNMAYAAQKIGDVATLSADNISRIRNGIGEGDVTQTLTGIRQIGNNLRFAQNGRIIVSSVQPIVNALGIATDQKIRWQRCMGSLAAGSSYGVQGDLLGVTGMGPATRKVAAAPGTEMIFVEVVYTYQPLISNAFMGQRTLRAIASMTVRERISDDIQASGTASPC